MLSLLAWVKGTSHRQTTVNMTINLLCIYNFYNILPPFHSLLREGASMDDSLIFGDWRKLLMNDSVSDVTVLYCFCKTYFVY